MLKLLLRCCYGDKKGSPVEGPPVVKLLISDSAQFKIGDQEKICVRLDTFRITLGNMQSYFSEIVHDNSHWKVVKSNYFRFLKF